MTGISIKPLTILGDNQGLLALTRDNKYHLRTKHIDLWYHFICEAVDDVKIKVEYIDAIIMLLPAQIVKISDKIFRILLRLLIFVVF